MKKHCILTDTHHCPDGLPADRCANCSRKMDLPMTWKDWLGIVFALIVLTLLMMFFAWRANQESGISYASMPLVGLLPLKRKQLYAIAAFALGIIVAVCWGFWWADIVKTKLVKAFDGSIEPIKDFNWRSLPDEQRDKFLTAFAPKSVKPQVTMKIGIIDDCKTTRQ